VNIPTPGEILAAFFDGGRQAGDPGVCYDARNHLEAEADPDEPVPYTLTDQAETALDADPEPEPEASL
jgi:hypothetical protein